MFLCLRVDLDYVPWDSPDASEFGHGEPATLLRMLEIARHTGYKWHFFVSERVLRAFPSTAEAVLNDGHDLDWLCKRPDQAEIRYVEARTRLATLGHTPIGMALRGPWPESAPSFQGLETLQFLSAGPGPTPGPTLFPVETKSDREAVRGGLTARAWTDLTKAQLRQAASRRLSLTLSVRPQVLARFDPRLVHLREILDMARAVDLPIRTLRDALGPQPG